MDFLLWLGFSFGFTFLIAFGIRAGRGGLISDDGI